MNRIEPHNRKNLSALLPCAVDMQACLQWVSATPVVSGLRVRCSDSVTPTACTTGNGLKQHAGETEMPEDLVVWMLLSLATVFGIIFLMLYIAEVFTPHTEESGDE
jgi:hypothetical protein